MELVCQLLQLQIPDFTKPMVLLRSIHTSKDEEDLSVVVKDSGLECKCPYTAHGFDRKKCKDSLLNRTKQCYLHEFKSIEHTALKHQIKSEQDERGDPTQKSEPMEMPKKVDKKLTSDEIEQSAKIKVSTKSSVVSLGKSDKVKDNHKCLVGTNTNMKLFEVKSEIVKKEEDCCQNTKMDLQHDEDNKIPTSQTNMDLENEEDKDHVDRYQTSELRDIQEEIPQRNSLHMTYSIKTVNFEIPQQNSTHVSDNEITHDKMPVVNSSQLLINEVVTGEIYQENGPLGSHSEIIQNEIPKQNISYVSSSEVKQDRIIKPNSSPMKTIETLQNKIPPSNCSHLVKGEVTHCDITQPNSVVTACENLQDECKQPNRSHSAIELEISLKRTIENSPDMQGTETCIKKMK